MRANLTFFFSKIAPIFSKTAPPKDQNGSVVFYFGPSLELKWPYTTRAESPLRGRHLIGAVLTPKKDLFCGQRFGPNFGVVSALLNLQCIQAVADKLKLKLIIAETDERFSDYSIVQAVSSTQQLTDIYLGHIDEYHYVSTLPYSSMPVFCRNEVNIQQILDTSKSVKINETVSKKNNDENVCANQRTQIRNSKQTKNQFMKQYRKEPSSKSLQPSKQNPEFKERRKQYIKQYRKRKQASEDFQSSTMRAPNLRKNENST